MLRWSRILLAPVTAEQDTATADPAVERRAAELGIRRVLRKPLSKNALLDAIREGLA
jgi:hypothetical protein